MDIQKTRLGYEKERLGLARRQQEFREGTGGLTGMAGYLYKQEPELFQQYAQRQATGALKLDVNIPALQKSTAGFLEREIVDLDRASVLVNRSLETLQDSFLTYGGKLQAGMERVGEKAGMAVDTEFLRARSTWMATAQRNLLDYRHKITGVAGKPEEYADIAKAAPDPERNSPTEFRAKATELVRIGNKLMNRYKIFLFSGITRPNAQQLISIPYENMPEHSITREEAIEIARQYGIGRNTRPFAPSNPEQMNVEDIMRELRNL